MPPPESLRCEQRFFVVVVALLGARRQLERLGAERPEPKRGRRSHLSSRPISPRILLTARRKARPRRAGRHGGGGASSADTASLPTCAAMCSGCGFMAGSLPRALPYVLEAGGDAVAVAVPAPNMRSVVALTDDASVVSDLWSSPTPADRPFSRRGCGSIAVDERRARHTLARPLRCGAQGVRLRRSSVPAHRARGQGRDPGRRALPDGACPTVPTRSCCSCTAITRRATGAIGPDYRWPCRHRVDAASQPRGIRLRRGEARELRLRRRVGERERRQRARQRRRRHRHAPARRAARGAPRSVAGVVDDGRRPVRRPVRRCKWT